MNPDHIKTIQRLKENIQQGKEARDSLSKTVSVYLEKTAETKLLVEKLKETYELTRKNS